MNETSKTKRIVWLDMCKGIAILLVVIGHMLRGFTSSEMYRESQNILQYIDYTIYSFHVPLFFMASGLLYSYKKRIETREEYIKFIKKKAKVFIIPYFIFSWLQIGIKLIMSSSVNHEVKPIEFITVIYKPVEQFWFLYALLMIFIIVGFCDYKIRDERIKLSIFIIGYLLSGFIPNVWISNDFLQYAIYFYIGRFCLNIRKNNVLTILIIICYWLVNIVLYKIKIQNSFVNEVVSLMFASLGILMITLICNIINNNKILKILGKYSMPIFLLHTILGSGIRIVLTKLHLNNIIMQISFGLLFGVIVPILLCIFYKKIASIVNKKIKGTKL